MSPLTRPIINIHVRLFRFPRYVIPAQCPVEPAQVSDLSDIQLPAQLRLTNTQMPKYLYTDIWRVSGLLSCPRIYQLNIPRWCGRDTGLDPAAEMSEEWEALGENENGDDSSYN